MDKEKTMTFTKTELAFILMSHLEFSRQDARDFVSTFFDRISESLCSGEAVKISGIGNFVLRDKKSRPGRNPKTKESIPVAARRVVTFHPSQSLKKKIIEISSSLTTDHLSFEKDSAIKKVHAEKLREVALEEMR